MSKVNNGGTAFPSDSTVPCICGRALELTGLSGRGMSLRAYFAAHAPENIVSEQLIRDRFKKGLTSKQVLIEVAKIRYAYADEMIAEGEKNNG